MKADCWRYNQPTIHPATGKENPKENHTSSEVEVGRCANNSALENNPYYGNTDYESSSDPELP